jgi:hypothetical protein
MMSTYTLQAHTNDDAETPVTVEYEMDGNVPSIIGVTLNTSPLGWDAVTLSDAWKYWDYSDEIDVDAVLTRCAEAHAERRQLAADRDAAEREDHDDAEREFRRVAPGE